MSGEWQVVALVGEQREEHVLERRFPSDAAAAVFLLALQDALEADEHGRWVDANLGWLVLPMRDGVLHELCVAEV